MQGPPDVSAQSSNRSRKTSVFFIGLVVCTISMPSPTAAATISLEATLVTPTNSTNLLTVTIDAGRVVGTDTENIELRGSIDTELESKLPRKG